jgi:hypothetical protein
MTVQDPVAAPIRALLELFVGELALVKFPELDAEVLRDAAGQVSSRSEALARAEAAVERARVELGEAQETLQQKAQRALAYARIYAEDQPELAGKLEDITLPRAQRRLTRLEPTPSPVAAPAAVPAAPVAAAEPAPVDPGAPAPKRRGRPPKAAQATAGLFPAPAPEAPPAPAPAPAPRPVLKALPELTVESLESSG